MRVGVWDTVMEGSRFKMVVRSSVLPVHYVRFHWPEGR